MHALIGFTGKDDRFDDKRNKFFPFLGFWIFQVSLHRVIRLQDPHQIRGTLELIAPFTYR